MSSCYRQDAPPTIVRVCYVIRRWMLYQGQIGPSGHRENAHWVDEQVGRLASGLVVGWSGGPLSGNLVEPPN